MYDKRILLAVPVSHALSAVSLITPEKLKSRKVLFIRRGWNVYVITVEGWEDVHPLLKLIPADWEDSIPFGVFYSPTPTKLVKKFIDLLSSITAR